MDSSSEPQEVNPHGIELYRLEFTEPSDEFVNRLKNHGFCVLVNAVTQESLEETRIKMNPWLDEFLARYDFATDSFPTVDYVDDCLTRLSRVGTGKHNVHFCPETSEQHSIMATLAEKAGILKLLGDRFGKEVELREVGLTVTRPKSQASLACKHLEKQGLDPQIGEGMEWHSDGPEGEVTMLLSLKDVHPSQGYLRIVPGTHLEYIEGTGHTEEKISAEAERLENDRVEYAYRAGQPVVFDARTLHSVDPNISSEFRVLTWYIFDCY